MLLQTQASWERVLIQVRHGLLLQVGCICICIASSPLLFSVNPWFQLSLLLLSGRASVPFVALALDCYSLLGSITLRCRMAVATSPPPLDHPLRPPSHTHTSHLTCHFYRSLPDLPKLRCTFSLRQ